MEANLVPFVLPTEDEEAIALVKWITLNPFIRDATIKIPNEGKRSWGYGKKLKSMGLRAGVSDFFIAIPNGIYHGLWIELKRRSKYTCNPQQSLFLATMRQYGYAAAFAFGWEDAKNIIEDYLKHYNPPHLAA